MVVPVLKQHGNRYKAPVVVIIKKMNILQSIQAVLTFDSPGENSALCGL